MGIRGFLKDIVVFYLCFHIFNMWFFGAQFTSKVGWAALVLFILAVWFMFERFGILPKL